MIESLIKLELLDPGTNHPSLVTGVHQMRMKFAYLRPCTEPSLQEAKDNLVLGALNSWHSCDH